MVVVVTCELGLVQIHGFFDGNINIQVLYIECEESVLGVNV